MSESRYDDSVLKTMLSFVKNNDNNKKLSFNQQVNQLNSIKKTYKQLLLLDNSPNINDGFIIPQFNKIKDTLKNIVSNLGKNEPNDVLLLLLDSMSADKNGKIVVSYKDTGDHKKLYDALRTFEYHFGSIFGTYFLGFDKKGKKGQTGGAPYQFYDNSIRIPSNIIDNVLALIPDDHNKPYWVEMIRTIIYTNSFDPDPATGQSGVLPHIYLIFTMAEIDPRLYRLPELSPEDHTYYKGLYDAYIARFYPTSTSSQPASAAASSAAPHQYGQPYGIPSSQYGQPYTAASSQYGQHQYAQPAAASFQYAQPPAYHASAAQHQYAQPPAQSATAASSSAAANPPRTAENVVRKRHEDLLTKIIIYSDQIMNPDVAIEAFRSIRMTRIREAYEELLIKKRIQLSSNDTQTTMFLIDLAVARMTSPFKGEVDDAKKFLEDISAKIKKDQETWRDILPHWSTVAGTAVGASEAGAICAMAYGAVRYCNNSRLLWLASGFDSEFAQIATGAIALATVPLLTRAWQHGSAAAGWFRKTASKSNDEKAQEFLTMRDELELALRDGATTVVKAGIKVGVTTVAGSIALLCGVSLPVVAGLVLPDGATAARSMLGHAQDSLVQRSAAATAAAATADAAEAQRMKMGRQEQARREHNAQRQAQQLQPQRQLRPLNLRGIIPGEQPAASSSGNASAFPSGSPPPPPPPPSGSSLAGQPSQANNVLRAAASSMARPENQGRPQGGKRHHKRTRKHRTRKANKKYPTRRR